MYILNYENYFKALSFNFVIYYETNNSGEVFFDLRKEDKQGDNFSILKGEAIDATTEAIDGAIKDFLFSYIEDEITALAMYSDVEICKHWGAWEGFTINGVDFDLLDYNNDYLKFLKAMKKFIKKQH